MIHVANDTKQNHILYYRLRGGEGGQLLGPYTVTIPTGGQVAVGQDWDESNHNFFIQQIERHGAKDMRDLDRSVKRHTGLLYSFDKPVPKERIEEGHSQVVETQKKRSAEEATKAALAYDRVANGLSRRGTRRNARSTEVEVEQQVDPRERPTGDEIHFRMGVDTEGTQPVSISID